MSDSDMTLRKKDLNKLKTKNSSKKFSLGLKPHFEPYHGIYWEFSSILYFKILLSFLKKAIQVVSLYYKNT